MMMMIMGKEKYPRCHTGQRGDKKRKPGSLWDKRTLW